MHTMRYPFGVYHHVYTCAHRGVNHHIQMHHLKEVILDGVSTTTTWRYWRCVPFPRRGATPQRVQGEVHPHMGMYTLPEGIPLHVLVPS